MRMLTLQKFPTNWFRENPQALHRPPAVAKSQQKFREKNASSKLFRYITSVDMPDELSKTCVCEKTQEICLPSYESLVDQARKPAKHTFSERLAMNILYPIAKAVHKNS
jgi:hypothetical protein